MSSSTSPQRRALRDLDDVIGGDDTSNSSSAASSPTRHHPKKSQRTSSAFDDEEDHEPDFEEMYAELEEKYEVLEGKYGELQEENALLSLATRGEHAATIRGLKAKVESYVVLEKAYKKADKDKVDMLSAQEKSLNELKSSLKAVDTKQATAVKECADRYKTEINDLKAEHELKVKELKAEHKTVISELKKEQVERITDLKAEHKKALAGEEAQRKNSVSEIEERRKADLKEMKDRRVADLKEKAEEVTALKKMIDGGKKALEKETQEIRKLQCAQAYNESKAGLSVEVHANKQLFNEQVRQKQQNDIHEKKNCMISSTSNQGFLGIMQRPGNNNLLLTNGDSMSVHPQQMPMVMMGMNGQPMMMPYAMASSGGHGGQQMVWNPSSSDSMTISTNRRGHSSSGRSHSASFHNNQHHVGNQDKENQTVVTSRSRRSRSSVPRDVHLDNNGDADDEDFSDESDMNTQSFGR